jgi:predicted RNA-binding protein with PIN domain
MSIMDRIKSWFASAPSSRKPLCILDGATLAGAGRSNVRLNPREQIQLLRKMALFAEREGFDIQVVFEGHSLREVAHGEDFGSRVKVFFADSAAQVSEAVKKLAQSAQSRAPIVVAANRKFEEEVTALGARVIRANTFRKGMDLAVSSNGGETPQHEGNRPPSGRRRNRNRGSRSRPPLQPSANAAPSTEAPSGSVAGTPATPATGTTPPSAPKAPVDDAVRNLIDLVE